MVNRRFYAKLEMSVSDGMNNGRIINLLERFLQRKTFSAVIEYGFFVRTGRCIFWELLAKGCSKKPRFSIVRSIQ